LTRGTTTTPSYPGTTATTATNPAALATSNGTMFGFDLQRTHFNPNEHTLTPANVTGLVPDWTATTRGFVDSSPTVANGMVYVGSDDHQFYAFDAATGKLLWKGGPARNVVRSSPTVANGVVYVGSDDGKMYAFNASGCSKGQCQPLWTYQTGSLIFSSPAVADGVLYFGSTDHHLYAFHLSQGLNPLKGISLRTVGSLIPGCCKFHLTRLSV
jgi:outer membrane protein assembly factor BamB